MTGRRGGDLQDTRLLAGLPAQELDAVARSGVVHTAPANSVIIRRGESSSSLYVILSGRVKVYINDPLGGEKVLGERRAGDHLGEIALLGDSVRTASVATLENSRFLVLSRRPFMQCLARNPQIALNLDEVFIERCMTSEVGPEAAQRYRAWASFRRSGLPLIFMLGGCTGTGKSTIAADLSLRLDIGRTQSTDILREVMRLLLPQQTDRVLHASTFDAWQTLPKGASGPAATESHLVAGFRAQADRLAPAIDGVVNRSIKERASTIIEGIHVHPAYHRHLETRDAVLVPVLVTVPNRGALEANLSRRGQQAPARGKERYTENLEAIWRLQEYFIAEASRCGVAIVENTHVNRTVDQIMDVITRILVERLARAGDAAASHEDTDP